LIPDEAISANGRVVKCGFCDEEWFQENNQEKSEMNGFNNEIILPGKKPTKDINNTTTHKKDSFYSVILIIILVLSILFAGILSNKDLILTNYPSLVGFFEASDILKEVIIQNINWVQEFIQDLFTK
jgi:hypothetical protein